MKGRPLLWENIHHCFLKFGSGFQCRASEAFGVFLLQRRCRGPGAALDSSQALNIPLIPGQQDVTLTERQMALGSLMLIVFSRALLEPIKLPPPLLGAKVATAEQETQNYQLKKTSPSPLFYCWKNILLPSLVFSPHGVNLWDINDPLSCLFNIFFWQCLFRVEAWSFSPCVSARENSQCLNGASSETNED